MEENKNIEPEQPAQNIPEEIIPSQENILPEIEQSEIPASSGTAIITEPQTPSFAEATEDKKEDMEVRHHTHPHHGKKNWESYFWEFLMLFLAVFCGFLAEYQLEHTIENQREKKYIRSFIEDLKTDTSFISQYINKKRDKKKINDSLIWYLNSPEPNQYGQRIYFLARQLTRSFNFFPADRTIKQLKYSGGLRLIKNQQASDSIMAYDQATEWVLLTQSRQENEINEIRPMMGRLLNANILETMIDGDIIHPPSGNPALRTSTNEFVLDFIYAVHQLKTSDVLKAARLQKLKERATIIMQFLQHAYRIEK